MKLTRKQCREIAEKITNEELKQMLDNAKNNITDWTRMSNSNKHMTKGTAWNMFAKDFDVNTEYSNLIKVRLLIEFGSYLPYNLKPYKQFKKPEKKEKQIKHEEPIFEDNSDNNESYYTECAKLLNKLLFIIHGPVCELCRHIFKNETYLMPIHILSKGSFKRLQFYLENIIWGCHECHKSYDEGYGYVKFIILDKMRIIKNKDDLINSLKRLYEGTPLLKNQNVKENLKKFIIEAELINKNKNLI